MERENWINEIIATTNQIEKVEPRDALFAKIENQLKKQQTVNTRFLWLIAASILVLVSLNIKVIFTEIQTVKQSQTTALAASITDSNQFYTLNND